LSTNNHSSARDRETIEQLINILRPQLGDENILSDPNECWTYGYDNSRLHCCPDLVVFPRTHEEVQVIVQACHDLLIPLVARGRGTGTTGAAVPIRHGVVLSTEKMDRVIEVDPLNRLMIVQPGVLNETVQQTAKEFGFFWPPDPSSASVCSIGGNLAHNSAGPRAIKYGTARENTLGLRAVTGQAKAIQTGFYTTKGTVGFDLTRLLIGSEGTLAVITEATLKLIPLPETKSLMRAIYKTMQAAAQAVMRIMQQPVIPCALEFIDTACVNLIRENSSISLPPDANALLLIEVDGMRAAMPDSLQAIRDCAQAPELIAIDTANTPQAVTQLWQVRKALSPLLRDIAPKKINEDIVVPVSHLAEFIEHTQFLAEQYQIQIVNFGHAGNGNIHVNLLIDPNDPQQTKNADDCLREVFALTLKMRGTLSGEHGIGIAKSAFLTDAIEPNALALMQQIKRVFDPKMILNPGKIFSSSEQNT
jgi:D-lactate dehydrogenase